MDQRKIRLNYNDKNTRKVCFECIVRPACTKVCEKFLEAIWPDVLAIVKDKKFTSSLEDWRKWWFEEVPSNYYVEWSREENETKSG